MLILCISGIVILFDFTLGLHRSDIARKLHSTLFLGDFGHYVVGIISLLVIVENITGYWLWINEARVQSQIAHSHNKSVWIGICRSLKWNFPTKIWGCHVTSGFWCGIPLLVMALTGLTWSFDWFGNLVYNLFKSLGTVKFYHLIASLHTGSWGSIYSRMLWLIAIILGSSLPLTGYLLFIKRKKHNRF